jgi:hypothetical protein
MKIIALLPIKNEATVLDGTLRFLSSFCDHIIIADQQSVDSSRSISSNYSKVTVIENKRTYHSNEVRWDLLQEARKYDGNNILFMLDADEYIPVSMIPALIETIRHTGPGSVFSLPWIQLWKKPSRYRIDWPWGKNYKSCIFFDDRISDYEHKVILNDHTNRVPSVSFNRVYKLTIPLLHTQYLQWEHVQKKQAWYRCKELINSPRSAKRINLKYEITLDTLRTRTCETPESWLQGLSTPLENTYNTDWHVQEIKKCFDIYGINFFEPLEIWHIPDLYQVFIEKMGRKPLSKAYPRLIKSLYYAKHHII